MLKIGIVGLPNVGKSTLFNALTKTQAADAQNYPFCTIDPNVGVVEVPDHRLEKLSQASGSQKIIPAAIEFVDIAGLVKGASQGEGLGNQFLANIRECNAIAHVIRNFEDKNVTHVHGEINPKTDREVIESELLLADLQTVEKRRLKAISEAKSGDKSKKEYLELIERLFQGLNSGILAVDLGFSDEEKLLLRDLHLLTSKQQLYVVNVHENDISGLNIEEFADTLATEPNKIIPISAKIESDLIGFSPQEVEDFLNDMGIPETGLQHLIRSAYDLLNLQTYFTSGEKETRAWTIQKGHSAPQAAGVIHTDFEKGFIKAEVVHWEDFVTTGGHSKAKETGKLRIEGKEYIVKDGDVMLFRFSN